MRRVFVLAVAVLLAGLDGGAAADLVVLHTSDLHGRVAAVDALEDRDLGGGLARVATVVQAARAEGRPLLLLDSGDTIQGAPEQAIAFAAGAGSEDPIVAVMNRLGYAAMAVGNHEFDFGPARLAASRKQAAFPMLSANALGAAGEPAFEPYTVREVAGVRVGILGLTTAQAAIGQPPEAQGGVRFEDPVAAARKWVPVLRGKERCDFVIVIAHLGLEKDPKTGAPAPGGRDDRAYAVATEVPGIDMLLAGHRHALVAPAKVGTVWVSEPGQWGAFVTRYDVAFTKTPAGLTNVRVEGRNLPMKGVAPDPATAAQAAPSHEAAMSRLGQGLAELTAPATTRTRTRGEDNGIVDWIHRVQLASSGADVSFASALAFDPLDWPAGPLTLRQVWQLYPYQNRLVTLRVTGRVVRVALERAAACIADPAERLRDCDSLEGADYTLDLSQPAGRRVTSLSRGGKAVADDAVFTVAVNSYRAAGGAGYAMWRSAERVREGGDIRDLLAADAKTAGRLTLTPTGNWRVEPRSAP